MSPRQVQIYIFDFMWEKQMVFIDHSLQLDCLVPISQSFWTKLLRSCWCVYWCCFWSCWIRARVRRPKDTLPRARGGPTWYGTGLHKRPVVSRPIKVDRAHLCWDEPAPRKCPSISTIREAKMSDRAIADTRTLLPPTFPLSLFIKITVQKEVEYQRNENEYRSSQSKSEISQQLPVRSVASIIHAIRGIMAHLRLP